MSELAAEKADLDLMSPRVKVNSKSSQLSRILR